MIKKIMFATAKAGFRKLRKEHQSQVRRAKRAAKKNINIPVEPYDLKKKAFKRSFRKTKFMDKAAYLAAPKTKKLPRGGKPTMIGKAFASDKRGKGLQVPMITKGQRKAIQRSISDSVRTFLREKGVKGYKSGGMNKKSFLVGGLLTKGIKSFYKSYKQAGGKKVADIAKQSKVSRAAAKSDVKSELRRIGGGKRTVARVQRDSLKNKSGTFNRMQRHKLQKKVRDLTQDINKLK